MFTVVGKTHDAGRVHNERSRQALHITGRLALGVPLRGGARPGLQSVGREHPQHVAPLHAKDGVKLRFLIRHAFHARRKFIAELARVFGLPQTDGDDAQPGRFYLFVVQLQLSQPFAAVNSTKVAQERQQHRAVLPVRRQTHFLLVDIHRYSVRGTIAWLQFF